MDELGELLQKCRDVPSLDMLSGENSMDLEAAMVSGLLLVTCAIIGGWAIISNMCTIIIGVSLSEPHTYCTAVQNPPNIYIYIYIHVYIYIIESVDSISRDEPDSPLTQYITNAGISRARYTITHFKHHHRVLRLISNRISV